MLVVLFFQVSCHADEPGDDPSQWGIVTLVRWKERVPATEKASAGVRFETIRGLNTGFTPFPSTSFPGPVVYESDQKLIGNPGDERILVGFKRGQRDYANLVWDPNPAQQEFLKNIPLRDGNDELPLVAYHWGFLTNPDRKIARTSEIGFEQARIDTLVRLGRTLKVEEVQPRFRASIENNSLHAALAVVYASSGRDRVAAEIREFAIPTGRFTQSSEVAAAFLLAHGEKGLSEVEEFLQSPKYKGQDRLLITSLGQLPAGDPFSAEKTRVTLWEWAKDDTRSRSALSAMRSQKDPTLARFLETRFVAPETTPQLKRAVIESVIRWVNDPLAKDNAEWMTAGQQLLSRLKTLDPALIAEVEATQENSRPQSNPAP